MSQFKKESSKKTVQKKDHTQTNTLRSHERSDIQGTHSTISTNFGLQYIALQPAQQFPFGLYGANCNNVEILKRKCSDKVSDLPSINFLLRYLDLHVAKDPTGLEAFVEIYNDDELSDSEIASSMELIPRTKPFNDEEKVLQVAGYRLPPIFFTSANKFPYSERTLAIPPDVLYCQTNDKYYTQDEIAEYLKNSDHNYDWIINELINELHALYIRVRNLDNNKVMLQDFVKIMLPSIAEYIHIIDKLVVHVRKLFIDWRNKLWVALLNKYKELGNSYNKSLRKLSAIQIANMMSVEDIRKIWKQWRCNIDEAALEAAMESLRDVCAMGFRAIDVEESLNKAHDRFLCLYNDLFTNYDWIINELINELHALYIRVRNLDNNKVMLQDFVKIMLPSIAEYIHIIDKLVVHVRKLFIDWRNKLWVALLNKYKELGNSYNKSLRKLSAIQIANMMSVEDIRKIWKQWRCNIDEAALEAAMESLRDVCAMGFRAIDVEESLNKAHDRFLCLYNDLFTVNLSITTRYNIATSMDLSVYYFEEFKRKSSKKNSLF
ncbi:hypothetical protein RhiirC2_857385 [Rhizophagus irregularis]|uniref:Uncharacterized protein n=2 Tax=Rhizophagus irregularis TaxID=588596 RepID=A0A2N1MCH9_9GLOM|nr:hypothetical protein RhiirC2_857385 [Rhizophagus irregularis]